LFHGHGGVFGSGGVDVRHGDVGAGFSQLQGNCPAHASAGAGDQGDLIFQLLTSVIKGVDLNAEISRQHFGRV